MGDFHPFGSVMSAVPYSALALLFALIFYHVMRARGAGRSLDEASLRQVDAGVHAALMLGLGLLALMARGVTLFAGAVGALITVAFARAAWKSAGRVAAWAVVVAIVGWAGFAWRATHPLARVPAHVEIAP